MTILTADRGEQINRVAAMMLEIAEARDAEELAAGGMFILGPGHPGAQALDAKYKPLIAILMAKRSRQLDLVKSLQLHIRDTRDGETMKARRIGKFAPGQPAPLLSKKTAALLAPQGGVLGGMTLAAPQGRPARDRKGG